jgi:hypothetical protein
MNFKQALTISAVMVSLAACSSGHAITGPAGQAASRTFSQPVSTAKLSAAAGPATAAALLIAARSAFLAAQAVHVTGNMPPADARGTSTQVDGNFWNTGGRATATLTFNDQGETFQIRRSDPFLYIQFPQGYWSVHPFPGTDGTQLDAETDSKRVALIGDDDIKRIECLLPSSVQETISWSEPAGFIDAVAKDVAAQPAARVVRDGSTLTTNSADGSTSLVTTASEPHLQLPSGKSN